MWVLLLGLVRLNWTSLGVIYFTVFAFDSFTGIHSLRVARYRFLGSIPPKFEHKLRHQKQIFAKICTTVVLDKDENLLWSGLQWHRSFRSNEITLLPILLAAVFLGTGNCLPKSFSGGFSSNRRCWWSLIEICKSVMEIFWDKVFMVRNAVTN